MMASTEVLISVRCYVKIMMHSLKYPHATINGVILGEKRKKKDGNGSYIELVDCVPLFHIGHGLTPMVEVALHQIWNYYKNSSLTIAGYYQSNKCFADSTPTVFAQKITEKILENNSDAVLLMINNYGFASALNDSSDVEGSLNMYYLNDGKWKLKSGGIRIEHPQIALSSIMEFIYKDQNHYDLIDFDNHLDDIKNDWTNKTINKLLDDWIKINV